MRVLTPADLHFTRWAEDDPRTRRETWYEAGLGRLRALTAWVDEVSDRWDARPDRLKTVAERHTDRS